MKTKLFRDYETGMFFKKPLPPGKYLPIEGNTFLYDMIIYDKPIVDDNELIIVERDK